MSKKKTERPDLARNRKAWHEYEILEKIETGMVLLGTEVKALREGRISFKDAYVDLVAMEAWLRNVHISAYSHSGQAAGHEPERPRKLLLHRRELVRLERQIRIKGVTLVPLRIYQNDKGMMKLEIALAKGKRLYEKKQAIRDRDLAREADRELRGRRG